ncbi:MAG: T9SS type A sorting domain-containing protein [Flavobacterium sp.]|nr:T9SS type A sorting domain-containing protein [Flavobacterium sp.]
MIKKIFSKSKIYLLVTFLVSSFTYSQDILWEKSYGGKHAEFLYDAIPTPDYGFILAGSSISGKNGNKEDDNKGDLDYWLWKMDEKGNLDWQKSFGGNKVDLLQSIAITSDGGFILGGTSSSDKGLDKTEDSKGQEDFWVIKLNAKGQQLWQKTIGGSGMEKLLSIAQTKDGGYILGGTSSSDAATPSFGHPSKGGELDQYAKNEDSRGNLDYWVVKLKADGSIAWQKTIGGQYVDELKSIRQTTDGGYILGGYSNSPISGDKTEDNYGLGDYWIVKLDENGIIEWQRTLGGDKDDNLFTLSITKDGGFILGGNSNSGATNSKSKSNKEGTDFWVLKLDKTGTIEWQETYNYGKIDVLTSIVENEDGSYLIGGYAQSEAGLRQAQPDIKGKLKSGDKEGINDYIALKINAKGEEIWTQTVGSKGDEVLKKLLETRDGGYVLAGTSSFPSSGGVAESRGGFSSGGVSAASGRGGASRDRNNNIGGSDFWVVKLKDKEKEEKERIITELFPNPALSFTNVIVNFDYEKGTATIFDINGRSLQSIEIKGERTIPLEVNTLPQGIYIIEIKTNTETTSVKMIKK